MPALLWVLVYQCLALGVLSMPYQVPLQGIVGGKRTLVVVDDLEKTNTFSTFFNGLTSRGHELTFVDSESSDLKLKKFGEYLFDNLVIFAPKTDRLGSLSFDDVLEFSNEGGNVLVGLNRDVSEPMRDFVEVMGYKVHKKGSEVIDHFQFNAVEDTAAHTHILSSNAVESSAVLGKFAGQSVPVLFHGVGLDVDADNILAVKVLQGNPTTYSAAPSKPLTSSKLQGAGSSTLLVGALQARNNARLVVSGSVDMFSNAFVASNQGNELFCAELAKWNFGESGVLRFRDIVHHKKDGTPPDVILHEKHRPDQSVSLYPDPEITRNSLVYRIKDEIRYSMVVEEWRDGRWNAFSADDMQMEFVMLDPYVRKTMTSGAGGRFTADFTAPDSYGVFKFRVNYRRPGYSVLHAETQVSIRPFKHNEYDRFILSAYPYYISALSATAAFFIFSVFFGFSKSN